MGGVGGVGDIQSSHHDGILPAAVCSPMLSSSPAQRKKGFKKSVDVDEGRRRREETTLQIRKNKKVRDTDDTERPAPFIIPPQLKSLPLSSPVLRSSNAATTCLRVHA